MLKKIRNGDWAASRRNYAAQLVTERLTGKSHERFYTNEHMEWGKDAEPAAREAYTKQTGNEIVEIGLVEHPLIKNAQASPDGLIGEDGLIEIKCLLPANHLELLLTEKVKDQYVLQMQWQLACTGRQWCDFVSYDPTQNENMQLFIQRFHRDEEELTNIEKEVIIFLDEVEETVNALREKYEEKESNEERDAD